MMKKPERIALEQRAKAALQTSTSWDRWLWLVTDDDGRTWVHFTRGATEVKVSPEAIYELEETVAPRLFA